MKGLTLAALVAVVAYFAALQPSLPAAWRTPGSPQLYLIGVVGAALLLVPIVFTLVKRTGRGGSPPGWFVAHVLASLIGAVLVIIHSAGYVRRPPALLFVVIVVLVALGLWGRIRISRDMAATFASNERSFTPADPERRRQFAAIVAAKRDLLSRLDPRAAEATFSVTLRHWMRSPRLAWQYAKLARAESDLIGARARVGPAQRYWRLLHIGLACLLVLGILVHVATVTFFAGYVAGGAPITWWHISAW
ncbi:MAG TPA: hypothetical protein VM491_06160 [Burkholderiaceae bacterium]|nr:hypothetical protein [Burkholderiaceae bacterium]